MVNLLPQVACMAIALIGETHGTNNIELTHGVGYVIMNRADNNVNRICEVTEAKNQFDGVKQVMTGKHVIDEKTLLTYELISLGVTSVTPFFCLLVYRLTFDTSDFLRRGLNSAWFNKT